MSTIRGAGECDSASPTSAAARVATASRARCLARRACRAMASWDDGASPISARHQRGCTSASAFGRQTDRTASGEAATVRLVLDPCAMWADAMDSRRMDSECSRPPASSRARRSAIQTVEHVFCITGIHGAYSVHGAWAAAASSEWTAYGAPLPAPLAYAAAPPPTLSSQSVGIPSPATTPPVDPLLSLGAGYGALLAPPPIGGYGPPVPAPPYEGLLQPPVPPASAPLAPAPAPPSWSDARQHPPAVLPARRPLPPPPGFVTSSPEVESEQAPGSPSPSYEVEPGTPPATPATGSTSPSPVASSTVGSADAAAAAAPAAAAPGGPTVAAPAAAPGAPAAAAPAGPAAPSLGV
nr:vegetative cell wall protein gp1-like [Aegilops tauschii subsp. strangulata]